MSVVSIHKTFTDSISQVPSTIQRITWEMVHQLREHPEAPGLNFERVKNAYDPKVFSVRVNQKYRAILVKPEKEDVNLFVWIDKHDDAYRWAVKKRFEINRVNGSLQMWTSSQTGNRQPQNDKQILSCYSAKQLIALGIPEELVQIVYLIQNMSDLEEFKDEFPEDAFACLKFLVEGESYESVLEYSRELIAERNLHSTQPFYQALLNTPNKVTVISSDTQIQEILQHPFDRWRIFLHPSQKNLVEKDFNGPVKVLGGAGTGKTVVAMHRARRLAREVVKEGEKVLLTTFNINMSETIFHHMQTFCQESELANIEVVPLDRLAKDIMTKHAGKQIKKLLQKSEDREIMWKQVAGRFQMEADRLQFIKNEYERFIQPYGIEQKEEYLTIPRTGRKTKLGKREREEIWDVIVYIRNEMERRGWYDYPDILRVARQWLEEHPGQISYRSVIVDEAQDLSEEAYKLLRALVPKNTNDLFIVGDPHQRIYPRFAVLSRCGIDVRGQRSKRLRINYRTTEQIRRHAMELIVKDQFDDLDGGTNFADDISLITGAEPTVCHFENANLERQYILQQVKSILQDGSEPSEIALFSRTNKMVDKYRKFFEENGIETSPLSTESHLKNTGMNFGTMHRSKGLEFRIVIIAGVNDKVVPSEFSKVDEDEEEQKERLRQERSLLYVASTRARERLLITSYGIPSVFLRE